MLSHPSPSGSPSGATEEDEFPGRVSAPRAARRRRWVGVEGGGGGVYEWGVWQCCLCSSATKPLDAEQPATECQTIAKTFSHGAGRW